jgi:quercetin dioxygenase-like cupin family protein
MELKIIPWTSSTPPVEDELRETLLEQQLKVYHWSNDPNDVYAGHTHGYHKIIYVVRGSINFDFPTRHKSVTLRPGDRIEVPAGIRHSAVVGNEGVVCLEAHIY